MDAEKAVIQVAHYEMATGQFAQTTLGSVVGQHDFDEMLAEREKDSEVQRILDALTYSWGIKVSNVELKQIDLNETMIRAIAKQAEAERLRRAKVIDAEGELQAAERLAQAGEILSKRPEVMQLRGSGRERRICRGATSTVAVEIDPRLTAMEDPRALSLAW
jgi:regulator of protease activity HflC (stomatin/prohibitin superfamily)